MKTPLNYQCSIYDCAPVTFVNALIYLYEREEIDPALLKSIYTHCLDRRDDAGNPGKRGTSAAAMHALAEWIDNYSRSHNLSLHCEYLIAHSIQNDNPLLWETVSNGGVLLACVNFDNAHHYVLVTDINQSYVYLFDPFYHPAPRHPGYSAITDQPMKTNRRIGRNIFFAEEIQPYSLGECSKREAVLMYRKK